MSKLYIFGIGGTGSRVINSLTMLLACGVETNGYDIEPIIIDPDQAAGNKTQCYDNINLYNNIRAALNFDITTNNKFFKTIINNGTTLNFNLSNTNNKTFSQYIDYNTLRREDQAFVSTLFSDKNLASNMMVGFKGNPNIGSVVLNQFNDSQDFINFANNFQQGDRIFIISSIFGGTGASGFPLLAKNIRGINPNSIPNAGLIKAAPLGAVTVLPYFDVQADPNSDIDSSTFISKTKAALAYYDDKLTEVDALYYIGDDQRGSYQNCDGGTQQFNAAHFIELVSALSIIDFLNIDSNKLANNHLNNQTIYKEYGLDSSYQKTNDVILKNLPFQTFNIVKEPLTQFFYFGKYLYEQFDDNIKDSQPWFTNLKLNNGFKHQQFYQDLTSFMGKYFDWLKEMAANNRSFNPFKMITDKDHLFELVTGVAQKSKFFQNKNYNYYDTKLNEEVKKITFNTSEQGLTELFWRVTNEIVNSKFNW